MAKDKKSDSENEIALAVLWVKHRAVHTKETFNWNMVHVTSSVVSTFFCSLGVVDCVVYCLVYCIVLWVVTCFVFSVVYSVTAGVV